jgi:8-oxo-dGTP pyrophosphatase MutT (NUDIX family)
MRISARTAVTVTDKGAQGLIVRNNKREKKDQVAVLIVSTKRPGETLLVTSRNSKSWSLAKGNLDHSLGPVEAARREAFEEAGVRGRVSAASLGTYTHHKSAGGVFRVRVFKMHVQDQLSNWPEKKERQRRWVSIKASLELIPNPSLRRLITAHFKVKS